MQRQIIYHLVWLSLFLWMFVPPQTAWSEQILPTVEDIELDRSVTPLIPPTNQELQRALGDKYIEIARQDYEKNNLQDSLDAYLHASSLLGQGFGDYMARGIVFGDLGRWSSAFADFRKATKGSHSFEGVERIIKYLLEHNKNEVALEIAKVFDDDEPTSALLLLRSQVMAMNHRQREAINYAKLAYYLDAINGSDLTASRNRLTTLNQQPEENIAPIKSAANRFWDTVDTLIAQGHAVDSNQLTALIEAPYVVTGYDMIGKRRTQLGYLLKNPTSPIKVLAISSPSEENVAVMRIEPNVFTCCLNESDMQKHFGNSLEKGEFGGIGGDESMPEPKRMQLTQPWGVVEFTLRQSGAKYLKSVGIIWKEKPKSQTVTVKTEAPKDNLEVAKAELSRRNYVGVKRALYGEISKLNNEAKYHSVLLKQRYEQLKQQLVNLYTEIHKPEIAEYCRRTSFLDLAEECASIIGDPKRDLPEFSPFSSDRWKVSCNVQRDEFFVFSPHFGNFGLPADNALSAYLKKIIPVEQRSFLKQVEISRPPAELIDAGIFGTQ
jgi:hypothetical protein